MCDGQSDRQMGRLIDRQIYRKNKMSPDPDGGHIIKALMLNEDLRVNC